jgi:hypothetical protein
MGVDSVELLMEFEQYFGINIPDEQAGNMISIGLAVDCIARHLSISREECQLQTNTFNIWSQAFRQYDSRIGEISLSNSASKFYSPENKAQKVFLEAIIHLEIPDFRAKLSGKLAKYFKLALSYDWTVITMAQFVDAINAHNLNRTVDRRGIKDKYEIYLAVMKLTVEKIGVEYFEISRDKSFTTDLGID